MQKALEKRGKRCLRIDRNRSDVDFSLVRACLFRTTWDYFHRFERFKSWLMEVTSGELALMVIDGAVTHAVRKVAKVGDFRVQDDFGGTIHPHRASPEEIAFAERAIASCPETPVYARVDIIRDNAGELALAELELIEPEMWFRENPAAADRLAGALIRMQEA